MVTNSHRVPRRSILGRSRDRAPLMIKPLLQTATISALAVGCMFYPFMPGTYDRMAVTISGMAQMLGVGGLLLVPIGVLWLIYDRANVRRRVGTARQSEKHHWFGFCALGASLVVGAGVAMAALQTGASLAIAVFIGCVYVVWRAVPAVKRLKTDGNSGFKWAPLFLIVVPSVLVVARLAFFETAVEISRHRTIAGSAQFINAIESYRATHGRYPSSLESVHHDYDPPTVGVERYRYEPYGEAYNVFFEQPTFPIGTQEFVMYNPRDEHVMMVHNQDLLESAQEQVEGERNFHARRARDTGVPHWKYFWFD